MREDKGIITAFNTGSGPLVVQGGDSADRFKTLTLLISQTLAQSSRRVYLHTYGRWYDFAERHQLDTLDLRSHLEHMALTHEWQNAPPDLLQMLLEEPKE